MKKLFFLPLLGLMFTGCINEPAVETGGEQTPTVSASSYLSISLVSAQVAGTRVDSTYDEDDGTYVDGTKEENTVERVRFFFFDAEDGPANVWKNSTTNSYNSYLDWYPSEADKGNAAHGETVEKILTATLGLSFAEGEEPASVMAIINPTEDILALGTNGNGNASLAQLLATVKDFKTGLHGEKDGEYFVMSNSVYVENEGSTEPAPSVVYTTALAEENFCLTPEDAKDHPITIYVERVLARLDFAIDMEESTLGAHIYQITKPNDDNYVVSDGTTEGEVKIYAKLLGWNITTTTNQSRLVKEIYPSWTNTLLFGQASPRWNTADYHRSFWALNPNPETAKDFKYLYGNFGKVDGADNVSDSDYPANGNPLPDKDNTWRTVYLQENASAYPAAGKDLTGPADSTKVIIAAQLLGEDGKPLKLAMWGYKYYTLNQLKTVFANRLSLYYDDTVDGKAVLTKIKPEHIDFMTWAQLQAASKTTGVSSTTTTEDADYYVYPVLSAAGQEKTWNKGSVKDNNTALTAVQANTLMRDELNHAMVWNNGWTYYYFDVRHLGKEGSIGHVGIVRNHLYATTVTSLKGLGTPVYDPDQSIDPEKPEYDESIVSASVKILSWRVVSNNYEIEWK